MKVKILIGLAVLVVLAVAAGAVFWVLATRTSEASAGDALEDFREARSGPDRTAPGMPPTGVYEFEVTGSETIKQGPVDISREFPGSSPLIVTHTDDGYLWEWRLSSDRVESMRYVVDERGAAAAAGESELSVVGFSSSVAREWSPPPLRFPLAPEVGQRWSDTAVGSDGSALAISSEVAGTDSLRVDGRPVDVSVVQSKLTFEGDTSGTVEETLYYVPKSGLVVRYVSEEDFSGGGELRSRWDATLTSLEPER